MSKYTVLFVHLETCELLLNLKVCLITLGCFIFSKRQDNRWFVSLCYTSNGYCVEFFLKNVKVISNLSLNQGFSKFRCLSADLGSRHETEGHAETIQL